jgi:hypothetical protein
LGGSDADGTKIERESWQEGVGGWGMLVAFADHIPIAAADGNEDQNVNEHASIEQLAG